MEWLRRFLGERPPCVPEAPTAGLQLTPLHPSGAPIAANELWANQPVLVLVTRRPGCPLCREEAAKLNEKKAELEKLGIRVVAVLKENLPGELEAFQDYWSSEVYEDAELGFFKAVGGGELYRHSLLMFLLKLLSPFQSTLKANVTRATAGGFAGNFKGEGLISGGLFIMRPGGGVEYAFFETELGDHAPVPEVMEVCRRLADEEAWVALTAEGQEQSEPVEDPRPVQVPVPSTTKGPLRPITPGPCPACSVNRCAAATWASKV